MTGGLEWRLARLSLPGPQGLAALGSATGDNRLQMRADLDRLIAAGYPTDGNAGERDLLAAAVAGDARLTGTFPLGPGREWADFATLHRACRR